MLRIGNFLNRFTISAVLFIITIGLIANTFFSTFFPTLSWLYGLALIPLMLLCVWFAASLHDWIGHRSNRSLWWLLGLLYVIMLGAQIFSLKNFEISLVRDPFRTTVTGIQLAQHNLPQWPVYFDRATNNVPITVILSWLLKITSWTGLGELTLVKGFAFLMANGIAIVTLLAGYVTTKKVSTLVAIQTWLTFTPFLYTYNLHIFYSDSFSILGFGLVLLALLTIQHKNCNKRAYQISVITVGALAAFITELIKPNFIVVVPALLLWVLILWLRKTAISKRTWAAVITIILATVIAIPATTALKNAANFKVDTTYEFPMQHWIMMGVNPASFGAYSQTDVDLTAGQPTLAARKANDTAIIKTRLADMKPLGYLSLVVTKLGNLQNQGALNKSYTDGFWDAPHFYFAQPRRISELISIWMRVGMMVVLIFALIGLWRQFKKPTADGLLAALLIAGLLVFHALMWESNNRYGEAVIIPTFYLAIKGWHSTRLNSGSFKPRLRQGLALGIIAIVSFTIAAFTAGPVMKQTEATVPFRSYGQMSNWGTNFGYPNTMIPAHTTVSQVIDVPVAQQYLTIRRKANQLGTLTISYHDKVIYQNSNMTTDSMLAPNGDGATSLDYHFKPGKYTLSLTNNTDHAIPARLQGAPFNLQQHAVTGLATDKHRYFIFMFSTK
ncbi:hypothetical protein EQG49_02915 [Periweissella cryptocerci]|uniref:Glycosyltransferase RgtA/B/C/D-like domain-containing protein n=1 Tax=Periweissella cryptocerci TaxID=2506420 RepID=A0A4P6YS23_9LACO|nr:hypothetical protein [Periweissella cryptocerci]QBO35478.1 hypothetical protein EQG49_02915 [Periweissella cryptocerci]